MKMMSGIQKCSWFYICEYNDLMECKAVLHKRSEHKFDYVMCDFCYICHVAQPFFDNKPLPSCPICACPRNFCSYCSM